MVALEIIPLRGGNSQLRNRAISGTLLALLLIGILALTFDIQKVEAVENVDILSDTGFVDSLGFYHIVGEVQNVGDQAVKYVEIIATFYDSSNVVATSFTYASLDILLAGSKSPFEVLLFDTVQAAKVNHYSLGVTFSAANAIPLGLQILSNDSYTDSLGFVHVVGEIENIGTATATDVKVIATFYNSTGYVVAIAVTSSNPSNIDSGHIAPFEVLMTYSDREPLVTSYALTGQSQQYAIIPEFPSVVILPLFIVFTILAIFFKKTH